MFMTLPVAVVSAVACPQFGLRLAATGVVLVPTMVMFAVAGAALPLVLPVVALAEKYIFVMLSVPPDEGPPVCPSAPLVSLT